MPLRLLRPLSLLLLTLLFAAPLPAKNARKLSLRDLNGNKTHLKDYEGRTVVLNFWATWCGPCKDELPRLGKLAEQYRAQNVAFVLLSIDDNKKLSTVRAFVAQQQISLPVWVGGSTELLEDLSGTNIVPATLVIDGNGEIVRAINGEARVQDVQEAVDWLLNGRSGPPPAAHVKRY